jgi:hypothetical protein
MAKKNWVKRFMPLAIGTALGCCCLSITSAHAIKVLITDQIDVIIETDNFSLDSLSGFLTCATGDENEILSKEIQRRRNDGEIDFRGVSAEDIRELLKKAHAQLKPIADELKALEENADNLPPIFEPIVPKISRLLFDLALYSSNYNQFREASAILRRPNIRSADIRTVIEDIASLRRGISEASIATGLDHYQKSTYPIIMHIGAKVIYSFKY